MRAKENAYEESQGLLAATKEELRIAVESLQAPIRITSQEEGKQMIRSGLHAVKSLELVKKQFQEWKDKYSNVIPASEVAERRSLEEKLKHSNRMAQMKEDEIQQLEESVEGARIQWKRFALSGHLSPTVFNIFAFEYTHVKLTAAPKETWLDHQNVAQWRDFWNRSSDYTRNILCVGWMMGWEDLDEVRIPIILAGSLPL